MLTDLLAWRGSHVDSPNLLFWRTRAGQEVDLVIEWQGRLLPIELKTSARASVRDVSGLRAFRDEYSDTSLPGLLLHDGEEIEWLTEDVLAVPWWRLI